MKRWGAYDVYQSGNTRFKNLDTFDYEISKHRRSKQKSYFLSDIPQQDQKQGAPINDIILTLTKDPSLKWSNKATLEQIFDQSNNFKKKHGAKKEIYNSFRFGSAYRKWFSFFFFCIYFIWVATIIYHVLIKYCIAEPLLNRKSCSNRNKM